MNHFVGFVAAFMGGVFVALRHPEAGAIMFVAAAIWCLPHE